MNDLVLPARVRKILYLAFGVLGLAQGALYVGYSSLHLNDPAWLVAGSAVFGFVVTAPFVVATLNVPKPVQIPDAAVPDVTVAPTEQATDGPPA